MTLDTVLELLQTGISDVYEQIMTYKEVWGALGAVWAVVVVSKNVYNFLLRPEIKIQEQKTTIDNQFTILGKEQLPAKLRPSDLQNFFLLGNLPTNITYSMMANAGYLVQLENLNLQKIVERANQSGRNGVHINIHGPDSSGKKCALASFIQSITSTNEGIVLEPRFDANANSALLSISDIKQFYNSVDEGLKVFIYIGEFGKFIEKSSTHEYHNIIETFSQHEDVYILSYHHTEIASDRVVNVTTKTTANDEINLFNILDSISFPDAIKKPDSISRIWEIAGGRRNYGGKISSFINYYFIISGISAAILRQDQRVEPKEVLEIIASCQLLDTPIPRSVFERILRHYAINEIPENFVDRHATTINFKRMDEEDWDGVTLCQPEFAILYFSNEGPETIEKITRCLTIAASIALPNEREFFTPIELEFVRHILLRLTKGRHLGVTGLEGSSVAYEIVNSLGKLVYDYAIEKMSLEQQAVWIGTLCSVRDPNDPAWTKILNHGRVFGIARKIVQSASDISLRDPRSFVTISKALNHIARSDFYRSPGVHDLIQSYLSQNDLFLLLEASHKTKGEDWDRRAAQTVNQYLKLLESAARFERSKDRLRDLFALIEKVEKDYSRRFQFEIGEQNLLIKAKIAQQLNRQDVFELFEAATRFSEYAIRENPSSTIDAYFAFLKFKIKKGYDDAEILEWYRKIFDVLINNGDYAVYDTKLKVTLEFLRTFEDRDNLTSGRLFSFAKNNIKMFYSPLNKKSFSEEYLIKYICDILHHVKYPTQEKILYFAFEYVLCLIEYVSDEIDCSPASVRRLRQSLWGTSAIYSEPKFKERFQRIERKLLETDAAEPEMLA